MSTDYHNRVPTNTPKARRYRGVSYTTPINTAKEAVQAIELADRLCGPRQMRRIGDKWVARCPLPEHEDKTPSFTVYTETNSWYCHGCHRGGDAVKLAQLAWGYSEKDSHVAAANLLHEFGHEIPKRPPAWFRRQERQRPIRDAIEEAQFEHVRRRIFRRFFKEFVVGIEDEEERDVEYRILWDATRPLAKKLLADLEERRSA
jgi:DNA primase